MISGFAILGTLLGIAGLTAIGFLIYSIIYGRDETLDNNDIVLNFLSSENDGRFLGIFHEDKETVTGRRRISYHPKGLDLRNKKFSPKEIKEKIKVQTAIVDPEKIITIPKGILEKDKAIYFLLPSKATMLPEQFQDSMFGKIIVAMIAQKDNERTIIEMLENGRINTKEILKKINDGEATREFIQTMEESFKASLKALVINREHGDKGTIHTFPRDNDVQRP